MERKYLLIELTLGVDTSGALVINSHRVLDSSYHRFPVQDEARVKAGRL